MMRRVLVIACCGLGLLAPRAGAAGGPVPPVQGGTGASAPGGSVTYVAVGAGSGRTVVERIRRGSGLVERTRLLAGRLGIPGVAYDGSTTGLSADGRTLVLAEYSRGFPVRRTRLVVLDARSLRTRIKVALPGWSTVDAISPTGRWLYLIRYTSRDATRYEVRAYDLRERRLVRAPVVDPREPDEAMQGFPLARSTSADGRWAYTLYDRPEEEPFIHALDTERRTAACIDLPGLELDGALTLAGGDRGTPLRVETDGRPVRLVDTATFAVRRPEPVRRRTAARPAAVTREDRGDGAPWELGGLAAGLATLGIAVRRRRRRGHPAQGTSTESSVGESRATTYSAGSASERLRRMWVSRGGT